ncbi:MAG: hypothetical protein KBS41_00990 [Oscillospiraceae bacterium]|nr:hypothetical protein [Candidatus Equicaccousia limihippi]
MQGTTIKIFKKNRIFDAIYSNGYLVFIFSFLLIGVILGIVFTKSNVFSFNSFGAFDAYLSKRKDGGFLSVLLSSVSTYMPFFAAMVFSGVSVPGFLAVLPIVFYCGMLSGRILFQSVQLHGLNGLLFNLVVIIIPTVMYFFTLLLSAREAAGFSFALYKTVFPGKHQSENLLTDFKLYFLRQAVIFAVIIVSALADTVISLAFVSKFNF